MLTTNKLCPESRFALAVSPAWLKSLTRTMLILCLISHCTMTTAAESDAFNKTIGPAIKAHCAKCHGAGEEVEGDLDLTQLRAADLPHKTDLVRRLIDVLDLEEMPPEDEPLLPLPLRQKLIVDLKDILHAAVSETKRYSHTPIRRMNRFQYNNAVIDLFDLKCIVFTLPERMVREHKGYFKPATGKMANVVTVGSRPLGKSQLIEKRLAGVAAFPQDLRAEHGFDNRGDHLSLSPLLMESFLKLGQSITQSPNFDEQNVGLWKWFFAPPPLNKNQDRFAVLNRRIELFLRQAFRRPVDPQQLARYVAYADAQLHSGDDFTTAMKSVAAAVISSPNFLYLYDKSPAGSTAEPIDDFELASRLSFFLWGSLPDQTLLNLAQDNQLRQPEVLDAQLDRMLMDHRLKRFCDSFPAQWLQLERIISSVPNRDKFPRFYFSKYRRSMHMMIEPLLLFETVLIENQSVTQLIDSDFTYRSRLLDDAYGPLASKAVKSGNGGGVTVLNFERIPVTDRRTGGVITNAAVMTMTAGPERTQPITRGAWVATVVFNNPPEPPPADVPALGEKPPAAEEHLTLRERLSMHRKRADCKGCHEQIDPLGFALENFDPVGVWRDKYDNGRDVDMSGTLFRKHEFSDVVQFKDALLVEKDRFVRALAGHLLSFGLARELEAADQVALDSITAATMADDYKFKTLIKQVVFSEPFQSKTGAAEEEE